MSTVPKPDRGAESSVVRQARVAGIRDFQTPTLEAVERRRWQLLIFAGLVMLGLAGGMMMLTIDRSSIDFVEEFLPLPVLRVLFIGLASIVGLYLLDKEVRLKKLTRNLVDERVLSAALNNRLKEISILSEVGKAVNQILELDDVLRMILRSSLDLLGAEEGSVMLLEEGTDDLVVACAEAGNRDIEGAVTKMGRGVSGWVAKNREPILISGRAPSEFFSDLEDTQRSIISAVSVPLIGEGNLYGVLNVNDMSGSREFTEYDLRAVGMFAEHAAIAIRNAKAFEHERQTIIHMEEVDRMKTDFIATISHELRTPLTSIIGCAKTIRARHDALSIPQRNEFLGMIERQGERLLQMIERVLSASKIESGVAVFKRVPVDIVAVAQEVVQGFKGAGISNPLSLDSPDSVIAYADESAVGQVLSNLIENARKYSEPEAPITVKITDAPGESMVEVIDRGFGISSEALGTIFDRFHQIDQSTTRKVGGVGLGLYIVKNLVEGCGGRIWVESEQGKGSVFRIIFPKRQD